MLFRNKNNQSKRRRLAHILAGCIIFIHAYEKYESGHQSYVFFAIAGLLFLSIAILHAKIEKKAPWIDGVFLIIESLLSFIIAYDYFHMGKKALPACYVLVGVAQLFIAFYKSKKGMALHNASHL